MVDLFAVTTRGLETVSAAEMAALPGVIVGTTGYRRVTARVAAPDPALLTLRTIDDLFADVATWEAIGPERAALATMGTYSARIDLRPAAAVCGAVRGRPIRREPAFSVTASFVGRRNYTSDEIKLACARAIEDRHRGWTYTPDDRKADLNVRVFLEHATAHVGVRVGREPLQNRPYKQEHVPGSLRPPVAAAMVWLAGILPGERVLDPCCGAGTLLVEAAYRGGRVLGGDPDRTALVAACGNAATAQARVDLHRWDARALPVADETVTRIVTNPPWGRKVAIEADAEAFYSEIGREVTRVAAPGARIVVLTWVPEWVRSWGLWVVSELEISLYGRTPYGMVLAR